MSKGMEYATHPARPAESCRLVERNDGMSAISTEDAATIRRLRSQCSDWQMIRCPAGCLCSWKPGHEPIPEEQISAKTSVEMPTGECDGGEVVLIRD